MAISESQAVYLWLFVASLGMSSGMMIVSSTNGILGILSGIAFSFPCALWVGMSMGTFSYVFTAFRQYERSLH